MVTRIDGKVAVWVLLIERGLNAGSDLELFWQQSAAVAAARAHLAQSGSWTADDLATNRDVYEAIEAANQLVGDEEFIVLAPFAVAGTPNFEGDIDQRPRCRVCREPIELTDENDPESWAHCDDAMDMSTHTAER